MALISCHECRKQMSSLAEVCPFCGAPKKKGKWDEVMHLHNTLFAGPKCPVCKCTFLTELNPLTGMLRGGIAGIAKRHKCNGCGHLF